MVIIMRVDKGSVRALFRQRHGRGHGVARSIFGDNVIVIVLLIDLHVGLLPAVTMDLPVRFSHLMEVVKEQKKVQRHSSRGPRAQRALVEAMSQAPIHYPLVSLWPFSSTQNQKRYRACGSVSHSVPPECMSNSASAE